MLTDSRLPFLQDFLAFQADRSSTMVFKYKQMPSVTPVTLQEMLDLQSKAYQQLKQ